MTMRVTMRIEWKESAGPPDDREASIAERTAYESSIAERTAYA